ncbi:MAG: repressor LexA [Rickettsiales bacterium]|nr:repressor LexA [Rickettsiales bacterium]|tara:strand:+ start:635 stop:1273 length:639 start_codon:yes stop_codon:yes gene_type:complete
MLTQKQLNLFNYLKKTLEKSNVSPSYEEMKLALGLNSKSGIHRLIKALEERGFIKRMHNKARAIQIINNEKENRTDNKLHVLKENKVRINIYGKIAAGTPIEAIQHSEGYLNIPDHMIKNNNQHYALKVSGTSMIDAGILDGDLAILEKTSEVNNGDIVVALIDGQEATLKRIRRKTNSIALEPANKKFETRIFGLGRVEIQGKLVGIIRNY